MRKSIEVVEEVSENKKEEENIVIELFEVVSEIKKTEENNVIELCEVSECEKEEVSIVEEDHETKTKYKCITCEADFEKLQSLSLHKRICCNEISAKRKSITLDEDSEEEPKQKNTKSEDRIRKSITPDEDSEEEQTSIGLDEDSEEEQTRIGLDEDSEEEQKSITLDEDSEEEQKSITHDEDSEEEQTSDEDSEKEPKQKKAKSEDGKPDQESGRSRKASGLLLNLKYVVEVFDPETDRVDWKGQLLNTKYFVEVKDPETDRVDWIQTYVDAASRAAFMIGYRRAGRGSGKAGPDEGLTAMENSMRRMARMEDEAMKEGVHRSLLEEDRITRARQLIKGIDKKGNPSAQNKLNKLSYRMGKTKPKAQKTTPSTQEELKARKAKLKKKA